MVFAYSKPRNPSESRWVLVRFFVPRAACASIESKQTHSDVIGLKFISGPFTPLLALDKGDFHFFREIHAIAVSQTPHQVCCLSEVGQ